jgi:hypothetical protein
MPAYGVWGKSKKKKKYKKQQKRSVNQKEIRYHFLFLTYCVYAYKYMQSRHYLCRHR